MNHPMNQQINPMNAKQRPQPLPNVNKVLAVASGKGGVGKSTLSVNLALALSLEGKKVGILDADIYGPSFPTMLGKVSTPEVTEDKKMLPQIVYGLPTMSIGYLLPEQETPMVWRGPMVSQALQQLTMGTLWPQLDYLILDLPPGTGDIQLTLLQKLPLDAVIIITTPQEIALADARKALNMFKKFEIPILGIVENMSHHVCSSCGHRDAIFGEKGGEKLALAAKVPLLAQLPLNSQIQKDIDNAEPTLAKSPQSDIAIPYRLLAQNVIERVASLPKPMVSRSVQIPIKQVKEEI